MTQKFFNPIFASFAIFAPFLFAFCPRGHLMDYHLPNVNNCGHLANYHLPHFVHVVIERLQVAILIHTEWWLDNSQTSNIAFLLDWVQMLDLDFGLIRQNISIKKASFHYQGCPLFLKSGKLWLNSYVYWISIPSNWFNSQQFSLPYTENDYRQTTDKLMFKHDISTLRWIRKKNYDL